MQEFKIAEDAYKKIRKRMWTVTLPAMVVAATIVILLTGGWGRDINLTGTFIAVPFVLIYLGFNVFRGLRKQQAAFRSYSLIISDSEITRVQQNIPTITINFM